jgi:curved DNA-binding protein CbpA
MNSAQELDPYEILQVDYDASISEIRQNFKHLVLQHHPDKGGNPRYFQIIKEAYAYVYKQKNEEIKLSKRENMTQQQYMNNRKNDDPYSNPNRQVNHHPGDSYNRNDATLINPRSFDVNNFNSIYQRNRMEDVNDEGYGDTMVESSKAREEVDQLAKHKVKQFNKQELVIYEEPEAICNMKQQYQELGVDKTSDYGNKSLGRNIHYTDYMNAYSEKDQITANTRNVRKEEYKTVGQLQAQRNNVSYDMNEEDMRKQRLREKRELRKEERRKYKLRQNDEQTFDNFERMKRMISYK